MMTDNKHKLVALFDTDWLWYVGKHLGRSQRVDYISLSNFIAYTFRGYDCSYIAYITERGAKGSGQQFIKLLESFGFTIVVVVTGTVHQRVLNDIKNNVYEDSICLTVTNYWPHENSYLLWPEWMSIDEISPTIVTFDKTHLMKVSP